MSSVRGTEFQRIRSSSKERWDTAKRRGRDNRHKSRNEDNEVLTNSSRVSVVNMRV